MGYSLEDFTERFELELTTVPLVMRKGTDVEQATETVFPLLLHNIMVHKGLMAHTVVGEQSGMPDARAIQIFGPYPYHDPITHALASDKEVYVLLIEVKTPWKMDIESTLDSWSMAPVSVEYDDGDDA